MDPLASGGNEAEWGTPVRPRLALVFTDIVGSTRLLSALGDLAGNRRILEHHRLAEQVLGQTTGGELINTAGDSMFLAFCSPREALRFALLLQRALQGWLAHEPPSLRVHDRVGIHYAEVTQSRRPGGAKDLTGLEVSLACAVMELAGAEQILLTQAAFDAAREAPDGGELAPFGTLRWLSHGRQPLRGFEDPAPIFEVGEPGIAPLRIAGAGAHEADEEEDLTGWRPAIGFGVPGTPWIVERFLGSSRFGEVWLARAPGRDTRRVLRFCFRADGIRAMREAQPTLQALLGPGGDHPGIARLFDVRVDHPPYYFESAYVTGTPLPALCHAAGGVEALPEGWRLEIIAQTADALEAAHRAGVVHGDLRPAAVTLDPASLAQERPRVIVLDFGVGRMVADNLAAELATHRMPGAAPGNSEGGGRVPLYWAPELSRGGAPTPATDLYALGVLLYQLVVGDLERPVTVDLVRTIRDPPLLEDVLGCLATDPRKRIGSAGMLAARLRRLPERRRENARRGRRAYWQGVARTAALGALIVAGMGWLAASAMRNAREAAAESARAQRARQSAEAHAVRLHVATGAKHLEEGDLPGALDQFVGALERDRAGDEAADVHRRRIGSVLRSLPRQVREWRTDSSLTALAIDRKGALVAAGTEAGRIHVWRVTDGAPTGPSLDVGRPVRQLGFTPDDIELFAHTPGGPLLACPLAPDGRLPAEPRIVHAAATNIACSPDGRWYAASAGTNAVVLLPRRAGAGPPVYLHGVPGVHRLVFSASGRYLAAAAGNDPGAGNENDDEVALWDLETGTLVRARLPPRSEVQALDLDPHEKVLLVAVRHGPFPTARQHELLLLRRTDLHPAARPRAQGDEVMWAGFAPRGTLFMSTSAGPRSRALVSDTAGPDATPVNLPHPHTVTRGAISPDGRYVLTACSDRNLRLWSPRRVTLVAEPLRHPAWRDSRNLQIRFLPDGRQVATAVDNVVRVFDFASHASTVPPLELEEPLRALALSPDGRKVAGVTDSGIAAVWDPETGSRLTPRLRHPGRVGRLRFDNPGRHLIATEAAPPTGEVGTGRIWVTDLGESPAVPRLVGSMPGQVLRAFAGPEGNIHALGADGTWLVAKPDGGGAPAQHHSLGEPIRAAFPSADGTFVATVAQAEDPDPSDGRKRSQVRVWRTLTRQPASPPLSPGFEVGQVAFSRDGRRLVAACSDETFQPRAAFVWEIDSGQRIGARLAHDEGVKVADFHPLNQDQLVTGGEDCLVRFWDLRRSVLPRAEQRMGYQVLHTEFSADGRLVAAASADGGARVWENATGEPVTAVLRHPAPVRQASFTAGARKLLTLCDDGRIYVWNLEAQQGTPSDLQRLALQARGELPPRTGGVPLAGRPVPPPAPPLPGVLPEAAGFWHRREADRCRELELWDLALEHLDLAVAAQPAHWPLHWQRARLLEHLGREPEAEVALRIVLDLDPGCLAARARLDAVLSGSAVSNGGSTPATAPSPGVHAPGTPSGPPPRQ